MNKTLIHEDMLCSSKKKHQSVLGDSFHRMLAYLGASYRLSKEWLGNDKTPKRYYYHRWLK